jgi:hypothetical protein
MTMSEEGVHPTDIAAELPQSAAIPPRTSRLALVGFGLGILSFALWASVGLPAPLVGVLAVLLSWLALRRCQRQSDRGAKVSSSPRLARWGLRLGLIKLAVFAVFLLLAGATAWSQLAF